MLRLKNQINCHTGKWFALVILGLITEKLSVCSFILLGLSNNQAQVRCAS